MTTRRFKAEAAGTLVIEACPHQNHGHLLAADASGSVFLEMDAAMLEAAGRKMLEIAAHLRGREAGTNHLINQPSQGSA